jgi:hypothetical protein
MMKKSTVSTYNGQLTGGYGVSVSLATEINETYFAAQAQAALAKKNAVSAVANARQCGELLNLAKAECKQAGRSWEAFIAEHFRGSLRTAQQYMRIAANWSGLSEAQASAPLSIDGAIKLLASPKPDKLPPIAEKLEWPEDSLCLPSSIERGRSYRAKAKSDDRDVLVEIFESLSSPGFFYVASWALSEDGDDSLGCTARPLPQPIDEEGRIEFAFYIPGCVRDLLTADAWHDFSAGEYFPLLRQSPPVFDDERTVAAWQERREQEAWRQRLRLTEGAA